MFGRKKTTDSPTTPETHGSTAVESVTAEPTGAPGDRTKSGPTPTRREREAQRRKPLVPEDRKAARQAERQAMAEERMKVRVALETGDERHMPARDRGPQRRYVRDFVDARTGVGEWIMPVVFIYLILMFVPAGREFQLLIMYSLYALVALVVIESIILGRMIRSRLQDKFGEAEQGTRMYGIMRALQFRRLRLPKPQVKRGQYPA
ncbi:MAG: DUF3043 domain-containing protein [Micrococcus sp.]|nr:DUF3043 domain-containing protein [Micrococcus sp.]